MDKEQFLLKIREKADLHDKKEAEEAAKAVLHTLKRRVTKEEAKDMEAQLSEGERELWDEEPANLPHLINIRATKPGGVLKMHIEDFFLAINEHSDYKYDPQTIAKAIFSVMKERLGEGESEDVKAQLPKDIKRLWDSS